MDLRKWNIFRIAVIILCTFFWGFGLRSSFAITTGVKGRVVRCANLNQGIPNIKIFTYQCGSIEFECDHITPAKAPAAYTNNQGYFEIDLASDFLANENEKQFLFCAHDPNDAQYITECYDEYYFFYTGAGNVESRGGTPVIVLRGSITQGVNFQLCEGGDITINLNTVPFVAGYRLVVDGLVNYKQTMGYSLSWFEDYYRIFPTDSLPSTIHLKDEKGILPYGNYYLRIEDFGLDDYRETIYEDVFDPNRFATYNPYFTSPVIANRYVTAYYDHNISIAPSSLLKTAAFPAFKKAAFLHGVVTYQGAFIDPNTLQSLNIRNLKDMTIIKMGDNVEQKLDCDYIDPNHYFDPNDYKSSHPYIILFVNSTNIHKGIGGMKIEIIPVNAQGQPIEVKSIVSRSIPTKVLRDPNQNYLTGKYGGYVFDYLPPSTYKLKAVRRINNFEVFSMYYGNKFNEQESPIISLSEGSTQRLDFLLPKTTISGKVYLNNQPTTAQVTLFKQFSGTYVEIASVSVSQNGNNAGSFSFQELVQGDVMVRISKLSADGTIDFTYNIEKRSIANAHLNGSSNNLGTVSFTPFQMPSGDGQISGRVFRDGNPSEGLPGIKVKVWDIEYLEESSVINREVFWDANTNSDGSYCLSNLPASGFLISALVGQGAYNNELLVGEMYNNVLLFNTEVNWNAWEMERLHRIMFDEVTLTNMADPNLILSPVKLNLINGHVENKVINFGLSNYKPQIHKGLNLFAYPGQPLEFFNTSYNLMERKLPLFTTDNTPIFHSLRSLIPSPLGEDADWKITYWVPGTTQGTTSTQAQVQGHDFSLQMGQGYLLYSQQSLDYLDFPPFYISSAEIYLYKGLNIAAFPDRLDLGHRAKDLWPDLGDSKESASLHDYNSEAGKWESMTWLWGKAAGENFRIDRLKGYLVYMKSEKQMR